MSEPRDPKPETKPTLDDGDIDDVARPTRRSAVARVGALAAAVFGVAVAAPRESAACNRRTGRTDSDPSDGVNFGHTNLTDQDPTDEARCGRGARTRSSRPRTPRTPPTPPPPRAPCTDSDSAPNGDRPGRGRHCG